MQQQKVGVTQAMGRTEFFIEHQLQPRVRGADAQALVQWRGWWFGLHGGSFISRATAAGSRRAVAGARASLHAGRL